MHTTCVRCCREMLRINKDMLLFQRNGKSVRLDAMHAGHALLLVRTSVIISALRWNGAKQVLLTSQLYFSGYQVLVSFHGTSGRFSLNYGDYPQACCPAVR